jgi:hypothetical protein
MGSERRRADAMAAGFGVATALADVDELLSVLAQGKTVGFTAESLAVRDVYRVFGGGVCVLLHAPTRQAVCGSNGPNHEPPASSAGGFSSAAFHQH